MMNAFLSQNAKYGISSKKSIHHSTFMKKYHKNLLSPPHKRGLPWATLFSYCASQVVPKIFPSAVVWQAGPEREHNGGKVGELRGGGWQNL